MLSGVLITIGVEFCLFITYIVFRAKKELKEEGSPITDDHFFI